MKVQSDVDKDGIEETASERARRVEGAFEPLLRAAASASDDLRGQILARVRKQFLSANPDAETIKVRSSKTEVNADGSRDVLLWERSAYYPNGEIFLVCEPGEHEVLVTEKVRALLRNARLVEVR